MAIARHADAVRPVFGHLGCNAANRHEASADDGGIAHAPARVVPGTHAAQHVFERSRGAATAALPRGYQPRRPQATAFYRVIADHLETMLQDSRDRSAHGSGCHVTSRTASRPASRDTSLTVPTFGYWLWAVVLAAGCGRINFDPQVDVGLVGERRLALGFAYTCLLRPTGAPMCWGSGMRGHLGYGNTMNVGDDEPPASAGVVPLGAVAIQIDAGADHTCAVIEGGGLRCWGNGAGGELGYGNTATIGDDEPAGAAGDVSIGGAVVEVAVAGEHACARLETGAIRCWGSGAGGRLGRGNTTRIGDDELPSSAGDIPLGELAVELKARGSHTCARLATGGVRCWGNSANGQLGYGSVLDVGDDETPAAVGDVMIGATTVEIAVGADHTCARTTTGAVRCWGNGGDGRLGYGNTAKIGDDETPAAAGDVPLGGAAVQLTAGANHTCARLVTGAVRCWGRGINGQLGYGNPNSIGDDETPDSVGDVPLGGRAVEVVAGGHHTCALLETGGVRCWGDGTAGQLGYGNTQNIGDDETPDVAGDVALD
jgi:alpha-tubulin suppressor-like RCC1 family protein